MMVDEEKARYLTPPRLSRNPWVGVAGFHIMMVDEEKARYLTPPRLSRNPWVGVAGFRVRLVLCYVWV
ncbi:hypothetical protein QE152_g9313 [Popillia japonica]|uniref:Uncharacterized protein n=1 Tax=Popillia japonica TaxID=7064 RepID=A0AAW1M1D1_POPJA